MAGRQLQRGSEYFSPAGRGTVHSSFLRMHRLISPQAIVLCLDLSESMSRKSGVQTSAGPTAQDPALDPEVAADSIAAECVRGMKDTDIVDSGAATTKITLALG